MVNHGEPRDLWVFPHHFWVPISQWRSAMVSPIDVRPHVAVQPRCLVRCVVDAAHIASIQTYPCAQLIIRPSDSVRNGCGSGWSSLTGDAIDHRLLVQSSSARNGHSKRSTVEIPWIAGEHASEMTKMLHFSPLRLVIFDAHLLDEQRSNGFSNGHMHLMQDPTSNSQLCLRGPIL